MGSAGRASPGDLVWAATFAARLGLDWLSPMVDPERVVVVVGYHLLDANCSRNCLFRLVFDQELAGLGKPSMRHSSSSGSPKPTETSFVWTEVFGSTMNFVKV